MNVLLVHTAQMWHFLRRHLPFRQRPYPKGQFVGKSNSSICLISNYFSASPLYLQGFVSFSQNETIKYLKPERAETPGLGWLSFPNSISHLNVSMLRIFFFFNCSFIMFLIIDMQCFFFFFF